MSGEHKLAIVSDTTTPTGPRRRERRIVSECGLPCGTLVTIVVAFYEDEPGMVDAMLAAANATHGAESPADGGTRAPSASAAG
jgi:hypothetical protein